MSAFDISKLKEGDPVACSVSHGTWSGSTISFSKVERFTPSQIVLANGKRFRRADGRLIGSGHGELLDPNGREATRARVESEYSHVGSVLYELQRAKKPGTPQELTAWLDRLESEVEVSRARLRKIVGDAS